MVSFTSFHMEDGPPIYLQIVGHVKRMVAAGTAADQEELPSRRVLSALLGVNPNTVQKAYRLLEEEGLIQSRSGAKSCVAADEAARARVRGDLLREEAQSVVAAMKRMGLSRQEALDLIARHWEEGSP